MKKLLKFLKPYRLEAVLGPFFKLLEACFELIIPFVVADIVDNGIKNGDRGYIVSRCLIMVSLGIIGLVCSITAQFFAAKAATGFAFGLRSHLFAHIQGLSTSEKDTLGTSSLITRMTSDVNQIQNGINLVLRLFLRSPFIVLGAMAMAFVIDAPSALTFVVTIPILSVIVFGIMLISIPLYRKVQSRLDKVTLITRENLYGTRVIRAFNKESAEVEAFDEANRSHTGIQMFSGRISALMNPLTYAVINLATVILDYLLCFTAFKSGQSSR
jgi:ABC-type multidrug transport system fused ATPase/permease subunit